METDEVILEIVQNPSKFTAFGNNSIHALSSTSSCNLIYSYYLFYITQTKNNSGKKGAAAVNISHLGSAL